MGLMGMCWRYVDIWEERRLEQPYRREGVDLAQLSK